MALSIRHPAESELPLLLDLWQTVFEDEPQEIADFLAGAHPESTGWCCWDGGFLAGMLFLLPGELSLNGERLPGRYLYAAATAPKYRRKGVFTALEATASQAARQEGAACIVLIPAKKPLFDFYQGMGYRTRFYRCETLVSPALSPRAAVSPCTGLDFFTRRRGLLAETGNGFDFTPELDSLRFRDITSEGEALLFRTPYGDGYVVGRMGGGEYLIRESSLPPRALAQAAGVLRQMYGISRIRAVGIRGRRRPYGMLRTLDDRIDRGALYRGSPYMNLMLD